MRFFLPVAALASAANAYFLTSMGMLNTERTDPIISPGAVASHAHGLFGGSNLRITTSTASLRQSYCTSVGIKEDKSAYWFPQLYFHWANGSFTSVSGGGVVDTPGTTTPFPDDFRMISGDPGLRSYDPNSFAQQAISFLCLDFDHGTPPPFSGLPPTKCPNGVRAQINFPSCWDGINADSPDHKSHVTFPSGGPDKGTCDPKYKTLPRLFHELYYGTQEFNSVFDQAMNPNQPFVFAQGDPTGYGYHGDFINGWDAGVLQKVVDECHCDPFGGAKCCEDRGIFTINKETNCHITNTWDEKATGTIPKLPGNNPVQNGPQRAQVMPNNVIPGRIDPVFAYIGDKPPGTGTVVGTTSSTGRVLANLPTNTSPPAVSSSSATVPPPSPVPPVTVGVPTQSSPPPPAPTATPIDGGDDGDHNGGHCYSTKDGLRRKKHAREYKKRHHRRMHNAAIDGSF